MSWVCHKSHPFKMDEIDRKWMRFDRKWMRSTVLFHVLVGAQRDRLFFSFPLLPRPPLSPRFQRPLLSSFLACLLFLFLWRLFSFLSLLYPLLATKIPAVGLLLPLTPSIVCCCCCCCCLPSLVVCVCVCRSGWW